QPGAGPATTTSYVLTRFVLLRLLGFVYAVAFLVAIQQQDVLIGHDGILPAERFLDRVLAGADSPADALLARLLGYGATRSRVDGPRALRRRAPRRHERARAAGALGALPLVRP